MKKLMKLKPKILAAFTGIFLIAAVISSCVLLDELFQEIMKSPPAQVEQLSTNR